MYYSGFADEASSGLAGQIAATHELGWRYIEARNIDGVNIHDISDEQFETVVGALESSGVSINCFGSTVANWGCDPFSEEDFSRSISQLKRAIPRMKRLNCSMIRGMSFARLDLEAYTQEVEELIFKKVRTLVQICEDAGILYMHENCSNYGGLSSYHTVRLLENIHSPNFKILFDTGNPVNSIDYSRRELCMQSSWRFYQDIKEFIEYVHIKDGIFKELKPGAPFNESEWTFPGEGQGSVEAIVADLLASGYDGGLSIEPHMMTVFHDDTKLSNDEARYRNYVEYGKRLMHMVERIDEK